MRIGFDVKRGGSVLDFLVVVVGVVVVSTRKKEGGYQQEARRGISGAPPARDCVKKARMSVCVYETSRPHAGS